MQLKQIQSLKIFIFTSFFTSLFFMGFFCPNVSPNFLFFASSAFGEENVADASTPPTNLPAPSTEPVLAPTGEVAKEEAEKEQQFMSIQGDKISIALMAPRELGTLLPALGDQTGYNFIISPTAGTKTVGLFIKSAPLNMVLQLISEAAGVVIKPIDAKTFLITTETETLGFMGEKPNIDTLRATKQLKSIVSKKFYIRYMDPNDVEPMLLTTIGENAKETVRIAKAPSNDDRKTSVIAVTTTEPEIMKVIEQLIAQWDTPIPSIKVSVAFVDLNDKDIKNLGLNIEAGTTTFNVTESGAAPFYIFSGGQFWRQDPWNFVANLTGLKTENTDRSNLISSTSAVVDSGKKVKFSSGLRIPIPQIDQEGNSSITYQDTGIIMEVLPEYFPEDNTIKIVMKPSVSETAGIVKIQGNDIYSIGEQKMESYVTIKPGETVALGGLKRLARTNTIQKTPFFSSLPLIGNNFISRTQEKTDKSLYVITKAELVYPGNTGMPLANDTNQNNTPSKEQLAKLFQLNVMPEKKLETSTTQNLPSTNAPQQQPEEQEKNTSQRRTDEQYVSDFDKLAKMYGGKTSTTTTPANITPVPLKTNNAPQNATSQASPNVPPNVPPVVEDLTQQPQQPKKEEPTPQAPEIDNDAPWTPPLN